MQTDLDQYTLMCWLVTAAPDDGSHDHELRSACRELIGQQTALQQQENRGSSPSQS